MAGAINTSFFGIAPPFVVEEVYDLLLLCTGDSTLCVGGGSGGGMDDGDGGGSGGWKSIAADPFLLWLLH